MKKKKKTPFKKQLEPISNSTTYFQLSVNKKKSGIAIKYVQN